MKKGLLPYFVKGSGPPFFQSFKLYSTAQMRAQLKKTSGQ